MLPDDLVSQAEAVLEAGRARGLRIATAESCTGGLVAAVLTEVPGSSDVFDRGFVTYSNAAKTEQLGVPADMISEHGAVSEAVARAMAEGAIENSAADLAVSITGIAGPGGGSDEKPVGTVHIGIAMREGPTLHMKLSLGDLGRPGIRAATVREVLNGLAAGLQAGG